MSQANLWEVFLHYNESSEERPVKGWKLCERQPTGLVPIKTRRGNQRKYKELKDAMEWLEENRTGYQINIRCFGYEGALTPKKN